MLLLRAGVLVLAVVAWSAGGCEGGAADDAAVPGAATGSYVWSDRIGGPPTPRSLDSHFALAFDGRLWVMGGIRGGNSSVKQNDVWFTRDGLTWTQATEHAAWSPRSLFAGAVFQGAMWIVDGNRVGDVWKSVDGVTWIEVKGTPFPPRYGHQVVVFHDRLFIIAGYGATGKPIGDVWSSSDGMDWRQETALAEFGIRDAASAWVFADRLWLAGGSGAGGPTADVWSSSDGAHWTQVTAAPGFAPRRDAAGLTFDGRMWLLGGDGEPSSKLLDAWSSPDGVSWAPSPKGPWKYERYTMTATSFADALWLISSSGVWRMSRSHGP